MRVQWTIALAAVVSTVACSELEGLPTECSTAPERCCDLNPEHPACQAWDATGETDDTAVVDSGADTTIEDTESDTGADTGSVDSSVSDAPAESLADSGMMDSTVVDTTPPADTTVPLDTAPPPDTAVCAAGSFACSGDTLQQCKSDSSGYTPVTACPAGTCNAAFKRCAFCTPNALGCSGTQPTECNALGSAYVAKGAACVAPQTCGGSGATGVCGCMPIAACPTGKTCGDYPNGCGGIISCGTCSSGTCDTPSNTCRVCTPSAVSCVGKDLHACNSTGTVDTVRKCPVDCVSGACLEVTEVAMGYAATCALISDGTVRCWGTGEAIGDGMTGDRNLPTKTFGLSGVTTIATSGYHTCARLSDGSLRCWGSGTAGQLGDGSYAGRQYPVLVTDSLGAPFLNVASVSTGRYHTCALTTAGLVYCWGENVKAQLGDGTTDGRNNPVAVLGLTSVNQVGAGYDHTCARRTDGTLRCWGANFAGQVGSGATSPSPVMSPTSPGLTGVLELVASGATHTCARLAGSFACWGYNASGQIGNGSTTNAPAPVSVTGIASSAGGGVGRDHSCALFADGTAKCWGRNEFGQVGDGTITNRATPVSLSGLTSVKRIYAGGTHSCALFSDGVLKCWGSNLYGQLGDGTNIDSLTPVVVKF